MECGSMGSNSMAAGESWSAHLLGAGDDALEGVSNLFLADLLEVAARGHDGSLVHEVLQVCASETGSAAGHLVKVDVLC